MFDAQVDVIELIVFRYKRPFSIDYRERGSHERGVYPTQDNSRMRTERVKQEEKHIIIIIIIIILINCGIAMKEVLPAPEAVSIVARQSE